ncbi:SDR family NAD(P)-dependent oxidoreductase [Bacillales bacterium AN1005]
MGRLDGKVAVITGGAGGMGSKHAEVFIREGAKVVIADLSSSNGMKLAEDLGEHALFVELDVTDEESWESLVKETEDKFGPISVLINNAGIANGTPLETTSVEDFKRMIDINLIGTFIGIKKVVPSMKKTEKGSIINISSGLGLIGAKGNTAYIASKFGVTGLTKAVAADVAEYGIRVNSVHPGAIKTALLELESNRELAEQTKASIPLKRIAEPEEISNLVLFLASDESGYSTASSFIADGGTTQIL